jgi:hypothetical protein
MEGEKMCDCIEKVNERLLEKNLKLETIFSLSEGIERKLVLHTRHAATNRPASKLCFPYCPFCGVKYEEQPAQPR